LLRSPSLFSTTHIIARARRPPTHDAPTHLSPSYMLASLAGRAGRAGCPAGRRACPLPDHRARARVHEPGPSSPSLLLRTSSPATSPASSASPPGEGYDWRCQWYPVAFTADLPVDTPTRAWLFDEPIAVARRSAGPPIAFFDACPHRRAALSEGRITSAGHLQCAYHGWTFDGASGACQGIPHLPGERAGGGGSSGTRTCARALPCVEAEGMVWVAPVEHGAPSSPPPPAPPVGIRELAGPGWVTADFVRSFPVDASLILENLCDPDHGLAHQTLSLDVFSAGGPDGKRMAVVPGVGRGGGLHLVGTVPATPVLGLAAAVAAKKKEKKKKKAQQPPAPPATATLEFEAPGFVRWGRVGPGGEPAKFLATFWVLPEGVGRSKLFIRYARSFATRLPVPRWLVALGLLHFLDQDTFLVATQQRDVLGAEAAAAGGQAAAFKRASVLAYRLPSEVFLAAMGKWLDGALPEQPNRAAGLKAGLGQGPLAREVVLDRWAGHTAYVPSSRAVYKRAKAAAATLSVVSLVSLAVVAAALAPGGALAGLGRGQAAAWAALLVATALAARGAAWLASRFRYCFTREEQVRDLTRIAGLAPGVE